MGQEAEQLRRTVRSLASGPEPGCVARRRDDCVSTCWPLCFLTGDLLNGQWQIYVSCYFSLLQEGIRKTRDSVTMGPPLQASKQTPKVSSTTLRVAQRHIQPVGHMTSRWPCDPVDVGFSEWWLQIWEVGGGGLDDEEILRKPLLISDALDELWWVEGRGGWDGDGVAGGGQGGGWRVAEVILLIYGFSTFSSCEDHRVYAQHRRGRRGRRGRDGKRRRDMAGCWSGEVVTLLWFMTSMINAKGYYPLEKVLAPWLKLCFATCLTGRSDLASVCAVTTTWRGVISCLRGRKYPFDGFIMSII